MINFSNLREAARFVGIPEQIDVKCRIADKAAAAWLGEWVRRRTPHDVQIVTIRGNNGVGKSTLAARTALAAFTPPPSWGVRALSVRYEPLAPLFERWCAAQRDGSAADLRTTMTACDMLVLDDLGVKPSTPGWGEWLYQLLDERRRPGKKTIVTTNLNADKIRSYYNDAVLSRLGGHVIELNGGDRRWMQGRMMTQS